MWDFIFYQCSVLTFILLYWFHKPKDQTSSSPSNPINQQSSSGEKDQLLTSKSVESAEIDASLKTKARQRLTSIRRRKDLVEHEIILSLGLNPDEEGFEAFCDKFSTFEYVSEALVKAGFCSSKTTFINQWLKNIQPVPESSADCWEDLVILSSDHVIHCYGFGDMETKDHSVFSLQDKTTHCTDYKEIIDTYTQTAKHIQLSGPTNFAPMIKKGIEYCEKTGKYHVLIMIVDGQVSSKSEEQTVEAIVRASDYPLSIIVIGIGDGPFGTMFEYDDGLPKRKFDNLQFVNFHRTVTKSKHEAAFALHALMELPDQYKAIQQLGYLQNHTVADKKRV
ncbi:hypothetical protein EB796_015309 [Bugula neritina]|uniref:Copine C-terminal domain-containing protein n=1 Tax=Bugula neritina TaxID=10212 RepID=A0A7J7JJ72_BUGNE|nr:hypothetical protein EB796_015309 [Bugula neritina]